VKGNEKLLLKFLTDQMHITVGDCEKLLTAYEYDLRKGSGSHRAFHKKGDRPIIIVSPKHTKYVKREYVELIVKRLNLEG